MQIKTTSTIAHLDDNDVQTAIIDFLRKNGVTIDEDKQDIDFDFDPEDQTGDDDVACIVTISVEGSASPLAGAKATKRKRRTKAEIEADAEAKAKAKAEAEDKPEMVNGREEEEKAITKPAISETPEDRTEPEEEDIDEDTADTPPPSNSRSLFSKGATYSNPTDEDEEEDDRPVNPAEGEAGKSLFSKAS